MMNPEQAIAYLKNCQPTLDEAKEHDKQSIQMIEELFGKHLMSENQDWVLHILHELNVGKKYIQKLGYNLHKSETAQDRYFQEINKRLFTLKDSIDEIDQDFMMRLLVDIDIIEKNIDKTSNIKNLIFEVHQEQYVEMGRYFKLVVTHNFQEVRDLIKEGDLEGPNSIAVKLAEFVNHKHAEMMQKISDIYNPNR